MLAASDGAGMMEFTGPERLTSDFGRMLMKLNKWMVGAAFGAMMAGSMATPAAAQDSIYMPLLTYRTGPFAGSGIPIADGMRDYLEMINQRDGGVNGVKLIIEECETGYDTKKGVECYEAVKAKNPVIVNPYSTGITLQLIPRAAVDKIPCSRWPTASRRRPTATTSPGSSIRPSPIGTAHRSWSRGWPRRKAASTSSRARSSASSISTRPSARSRSRCSRRSPRNTASS